MNNQCIFHDVNVNCLRDIDKYPTREHIILSCLGATLITKKVICCQCNNDLQTLVDDFIAEGTLHIRNILGIKNYDKSGNPPKIKKIESDKGNFEILPDGKLVLKGKLYDVTELSVDENNYKTLQVKLQGNSHDQYLESKENARREINKKFGDEAAKNFINALPQNYGFLRPGVITVQSKSCLISEEISRTAAKMLLIFLTDKIGNKKINQPEYKNIKDYIFSKSNNIKASFMIPKNYTLNNEILYNNTLSIYTDEFGNLFGLFQLLGGIIYKIDFMVKYHEAHINYLYSSNPFDKNSNIISDCKFEINLNDFDEFDFNELSINKEVAIEKVNSFSQKYFNSMNIYTELKGIPAALDMIISDIEVMISHSVKDRDLWLDIGCEIYKIAMGQRNLFYESSLENKRAVLNGLIPIMHSTIRDCVKITTSDDETFLFHFVQQIIFHVHGLEYKV